MKKTTLAFPSDLQNIFRVILVVVFLAALFAFAGVRDAHADACLWTDSDFPNCNNVDVSTAPNGSFLTDAITAIKNAIKNIVGYDKDPSADPDSEYSNSPYFTSLSIGDDGAGGAYTIFHPSNEYGGFATKNTSNTSYIVNTAESDGIALGVNMTNGLVGVYGEGNDIGIYIDELSGTSTPNVGLYTVGDSTGLYAKSESLTGTQAVARGDNPLVGLYSEGALTGIVGFSKSLSNSSNSYGVHGHATFSDNSEMHADVVGGVYDDNDTLFWGALGMSDGSSGYGIYTPFDTYAGGDLRIGTDLVANTLSIYSNFIGNEGIFSTSLTLTYGIIGEATLNNPLHILGAMENYGLELTDSLTIHNGDLVIDGLIDGGTFNNSVMVSGAMSGDTESSITANQIGLFYQRSAQGIGKASADCDSGDFLVSCSAKVTNTAQYAGARPSNSSTCEAYAQDSSVQVTVYAYCFDPQGIDAGCIDSDGDGACDTDDACPNDPNNDSDGDGACDTDDACPNDPDNDKDGDGICGDVDNCPNTANADQADSDGNGVGDACEEATTCNDSDNDGYDDSSCGGDDCDDSDPSVYPGAAENCTDGVDNDCDGLIDSVDQNCLNPEPEFAWHQMYGGNSYETAKAIANTSDGGFILGGQTRSSNLINPDGTTLEHRGASGSDDAYVIRVDAYGILQWHNTFGGTEDDYISSIAQTLDSGYILVGNTSSEDLEGANAGNKGLMDYYVVKLDENGYLVWQRTYGGDQNDIGTDILQTADGGYLIAGYAQSDIDGMKPNKGDDYAGYDVYLIKTDSAGDIQWHKFYDWDMRSEYWDVSIDETSDGGFVVATSAGVQTSGEEIYVIKLSNFGEIEWHYVYDIAYLDRPYSIQQTFDGGFIIGGIAGGFIIGDEYYEYFALKLDVNGTLEWSKMYGGSNDDFGYGGIREVSNGQYVISGYSSSIDTGAINNGRNDYYILGLDANGNVDWQKMYGGAVQDYAFSMEISSDGGIVVAGEADIDDIDVQGNSTGHGSQDIYLLKLR